MAYLDNNGVLYLWGKITTALSGKLDTTSNTDCYQYVFKIEGYYD